jgi:cbb3-type cytochrome oxidase subunit 1
MSGVFSFVSDSINRGSFGTDAVGYLFGLPLLIMFYSCIPISIHGIWFGYRISNRGKKINDKP